MDVEEFPAVGLATDRTDVRVQRLGRVRCQVDVRGGDESCARAVEFVSGIGLTSEVLTDEREVVVEATAVRDADTPSQFRERERVVGLRERSEDAHPCLVAQHVQRVARCSWLLGHGRGLRCRVDILSIYHERY